MTRYLPPKLYDSEGTKLVYAEEIAKSGLLSLTSEARRK